MRAAQDPGTRRMIATIAWLYHSRGLRQSDIAERLHISQSRVSRMLDHRHPGPGFRALYWSSGRLVIDSATAHSAEPGAASTTELDPLRCF